jgi:hypothetical protein
MSDRNLPARKRAELIWLARLGCAARSLAGRPKDLFITKLGLRPDAGRRSCAQIRLSVSPAWCRRAGLEAVAADWRRLDCESTATRVADYYLSFVVGRAVCCRRRLIAVGLVKAVATK